MIKSFKEKSLEHFFITGKRYKLIPATIEKPLRRKLDILAAASEERDLFTPTSNYYKRLSGTLAGWSSMRVSIQWRLMFQWSDGAASNIYLDPHSGT